MSLLCIRTSAPAPALQDAPKPRGTWQKKEVPEEQAKNAAKKKRKVRFTKADIKRLTTFCQEDCVATDGEQQYYIKLCKYRWGRDLLHRLCASLAKENKFGYVSK